MDTRVQTYASTQSFKSRKKLPLSPSTRKSWVQILTTLFITFLIVGGVAYLENEQKKDKCEYKFNISTIICLVSDSKLLGQLQNIGVLSAALLFFWDTFDRKKQLERQAWQLIDSAQGSETSGARRQAIEDLYQEGADITGLDADGADLRGINLSGADLTGASFKNAILEGANFERAILTTANFEGANLRGANFKKATLLVTNFTRSNLTTLVIDNAPSKTDFRDANLGWAIFNEAQLVEAIFGIDKSETQNKAQQYLGRETKLNRARFWDADLTNTNLKEVDIADTRFGGAEFSDVKSVNSVNAKKVDIHVISQAKNYTSAYYGKDFCDTNNFGNEDKDYYKYKKERQSKAQQILEVIQYITNNKSAVDENADLWTLLTLLRDFIKDSDDPCVNNNLLKQVLKVEDAITKSVGLDKEGSDWIKKSQQEGEDNDDKFKSIKKILERD
ncbi:pentapeptide repeat-containing protein [Nostoc sp. UIC 10630]|uniref:pentapeptide repeat-containing protein n=1 Tax=Nostoc sp. UIC 10630 TaxID=2100146 RepID=UPI0013D48E56|nr:pentapeptide repeat-containing protein [Nostoc sp. UIC 10630]NEU82246.1 pentapeptide repeat-containing protein [Nostoc sp. UIC 10630]